MNPNFKYSVMAGLLLAAGAAFADVVVDDFTGGTTNNMLPDGGAWVADSDVWPAIGGSSKVKPLAPDTSDLVKGDSYAGDNITKAYADDFTISSRIFVTADVSTTKKWAYAGWIMDFLQPQPNPADTAGGKHIYDLNSWQKGDEVDVSSCTSLDITLQFDTDRILWIDLFDPVIEKTNANAPQYGWRYTGTGAMETHKFSLIGVAGPQQKWADAVNKVPFNLAIISRMRILYEGMAKGSSTPMYDTVGHILKIKKVQLSGPTCTVKPNRGAALSSAILPRETAKTGSAFAVAGNSLRFDRLASELNVTVRDIRGTVVASGAVSGSHPSLDVSALKNGIYMVQAVNGSVSRSGSFTVLK